MGVAVNKPMGKMQGEKNKVLQTLINMSRVWKVWLFHTTKKGKLGKKLNNCTSLPFTTIFHLDKHKHFVCYLLCWCKAAMAQNHLFVILAALEVCAEQHSTVAASSRDA